MIYEHCRATGACEAAQRLSDLFSMSLQNDEKDFDTKWEQALSAANEIPTKMVLEIYTNQNCQILFSFRLYWLFMNKRIFETTELLQIGEINKTTY